MKYIWNIHKSFTHHTPSNSRQHLDHILTLQSRRFGRIWHLQDCKRTTAVHCLHSSQFYQNLNWWHLETKIYTKTQPAHMKESKWTPIFICSHFLYHKQTQWGFCGNVRWTHTTPVVLLYTNNNDLLFCIPDHQGSAWLYGKATSRQ